MEVKRIYKIRKLKGEEIRKKKKGDRGKTNTRTSKITAMWKANVRIERVRNKVETYMKNNKTRRDKGGKKEKEEKC